MTPSDRDVKMVIVTKNIVQMAEAVLDQAGLLKDLTNDDRALLASTMIMKLCNWNYRQMLDVVELVDDAIENYPESQEVADMIAKNIGRVKAPGRA